MARSRSKAECLELLFEVLHTMEPASNRSEAHRLLSDTLDKIEDEYSGVPKTYQDDGQRMYFWSLDIDAWENINGDPASLWLKGDHSAYIYNDGTIKIERHTGGNTETVFFLKGKG